MTKAERSAAARTLNALRRTYAGGRPKVFRDCPHCGVTLSASELRAHRCGAAPGQQTVPPTPARGIARGAKRS